MDEVHITYHNGNVTFWNEAMTPHELPLDALVYRYVPEFLNIPAVYVVGINHLDHPYFHILPDYSALPAELKAAALLMGAPIPE